MVARVGDPTPAAAGRGFLGHDNPQRDTLQREKARCDVKYLTFLFLTMDFNKW